MSISIKLEWEYAGAGDESLEFSRVLYAYLHPKSNEILYIGKADFSTVRKRLVGAHKMAIFKAIVKGRKLSVLHMIVGWPNLPEGRRLSSELLADIESLLIMEVQPPYNRQSRQSRIARLGLVVQCAGDWPLATKKFIDL